MITFYRNESNDDDSLLAKSSDKNSNQIDVIEGTANETSIVQVEPPSISRVAEIIAISKPVLEEDIELESNESEIKEESTNANITHSTIPIAER